MRRTEIVPKEWLHERIRVQEDGCWIWTGARMVSEGYGKFRYKKKDFMAHRAVYMAYGGSIPEGLVLDHLCRVRLCVNPAHLEPVTDRENAMRGISVTAANATKTVCKNGHPFDGTNTYWSALKRGFRRSCRACHAARKRAVRIKAAKNHIQQVEIEGGRT